MEVDSSMSTDSKHDHDPVVQNGPSTLIDQVAQSSPGSGDGSGGSGPQSQQAQPPIALQESAVIGPRPVPSYSVVNAILEKKEDGPGPRCGHTLTAVAAVREEGMPGYIGPRLILFGGATAGNSAASGTPTSAGSAGGVELAGKRFVDVVGPVVGAPIISRTFVEAARGIQRPWQYKKVEVEMNSKGEVLMWESLKEKGTSS